MHQDVLDYFSRGDQGVRSEQEQRAIQHADDPSEPCRPALISRETVYPQGWPEQPGLFTLRNDFPAQIVFAGESYASVLHGYWALSAADASDGSRIRDAASGGEAHDLGGRATHRSDWPNVRLAVMAELLRAKFTQHPELAQVLVSTGDARISYTGFSDSPFWRDVSDGRGRNWMGRLLELTRSELVDQQLLRAEDPSVLNQEGLLSGGSARLRALREQTCRTTPASCSRDWLSDWRCVPVSCAVSQVPVGLSGHSTRSSGPPRPRARPQTRSRAGVGRPQPRPPKARAALPLDHDPGRRAAAPLHGSPAAGATGDALPVR
ncbi:NADAR family protein [Streptomyces sp. NPDC056255]|uniref:NADAR family protein n=1 Tax=Streptomyces sp. NPDC056255 TaxID=3345764 RepID=UPI0035DB4848